MSTLKLPFGKYRGKEFSEIPEGYLAWIIKQNFLKEPYRTGLRMWLLEEKADELIELWMARHYRSKSGYGGHYYSYSDGMDYCPPDFDYDGDLFDAMQGCCGNGF